MQNVPLSKSSTRDLEALSCSNMAIPKNVRQCFNNSVEDLEDLLLDLNDTVGHF